MKKLILVASVACALFAQAETYTVPAGTTETVTRENAATYNAYESVTVPATSELDFRGPGSFAFTTALSTLGTNVVADGADVILDGNTLDLSGYMLVTNATLRRRNPVLVTGDNWKDTITVGSSADAFLEIGEGALVTNRIQVGKGYKAGVFVQKGGEVVNLGATSANGDEVARAAIGKSGQGYYEVRGGTNRLVGCWALAGSYQGQGVLALYDGALIQVKSGSTDPRINMYGSSGTVSAFYQFGGTASLGYLDVNKWTPPSVVSIWGSNTVFTAATVEGGSSGGTYTPSTPGIITFGGGATIKTGMGLYYDDATYPNRVMAVFNYNGVTARATGSWANFNGKAAPRCARFVIHENGLAVDVNGFSTVAANGFIGATGNGVTSIDWNRDLTFRASPVVLIEETGGGSGFGASAVPKWDPYTKKVTDIVIVSPGTGYTQATAYFVYGDSGKVALTTQVGPNPIDGGVRFFSSKADGSGSIYLRGTNAWQGVTEVAGGTVHADEYPHGIPKNAALRLTGGTLSIGGYKATFRSIGGTAGKLTISSTNFFEVATVDNATAATLDLSSYTLSVTGRWEVAAADLAAGKFADYKVKELVFAEGSKLAVSGTPDPTAVKRMTLLKATKLTGQPEFEDESMDQNWKLVRKNNQLDLVYKSGLMLILR